MTKKKYSLTLSYDHDPFDPVDEIEGFDICSFNHRHIHYKNPEEFGLQVNSYGDVSFEDEERNKLFEEGYIFILSCYEHTGISWFLKGEGGPGTDCRFDGTRVAGLVFLNTEVWKDTDFKKREEAARSFVKTYTKYVNGEVYGFSLCELETCNLGHEHESECIHSCWGFYDVEDMFEEIRPHLDKETTMDDISVNGDCKDLVDYNTLIKETQNA